MSTPPSNYQHPRAMSAAKNKLLTLTLNDRLDDNMNDVKSPVKKYLERKASLTIDPNDRSFFKWNVQDPLPKLPVPDLQASLNRYLKVIRPIVSDELYAEAEELVNDFLRKDVGERIQSELIKYAATVDNWAYAWWLDDMYMNVRLALPINSNPGMVFPKQTFRGRTEQLRFAARIIAGILDYKIILDARGLPIDRANAREKGQPLCMEQYYRLFTSYRLPGVQKDNLVSTKCSTLSDPEHIIVMYRGQMYVLEVALHFQQLSEDNLYCQLKRITDSVDDAESIQPNVGVLTSMGRTEWAKARLRLTTDVINRDSLDAIERSLFILCLDQPIPVTTNHPKSVEQTKQGIRDNHSLFHQMLHGLGSEYNSTNRWYDKTMQKIPFERSISLNSASSTPDQFVIGEDGAAGLNYEHSASEGIAVIQLIEHLLDYMSVLLAQKFLFGREIQSFSINHPALLPSSKECAIYFQVYNLPASSEEVKRMKLRRAASICELPTPRQLRWRLDSMEPIDVAKRSIDRFNFARFGTRALVPIADPANSAISTVDVSVINFRHYGREFPKTVNMSPDAYIQLALQLAYYKTHRRLVSTYESASTRRFRHGRVDNIRAASMEAYRWAQAMTGETKNTDEEKVNLLRDALKYQTDFMVATILGAGLDCHLLGLREMARQMNISVPMFEHETFKRSNHFSLSTSQVPISLRGDESVPTHTDSFMGYGAVVKDGYGASYNPQKDNIIFCISTFKSDQSTDSTAFTDSLEQCLLEMRDLALRVKNSTASLTNGSATSNR